MAAMSSEFPKQKDELDTDSCMAGSLSKSCLSTSIQKVESIGDHETRPETVVVPTKCTSADSINAPPGTTEKESIIRTVVVGSVNVTYVQGSLSFFPTKDKVYFKESTFHFL